MQSSRKPFATLPRVRTRAGVRTLGACGDVNRNVVCSPIDGLDPEHDPRGQELAHAIAEELAPRSSAYGQSFLSDDQARQLVPISEEEPIYGGSYLPRKFKLALAHPSDNSVDVLTNDVGLVPVAAGGLAAGELLHRTDPAQLRAWVGLDEDA